MARRLRPGQLMLNEIHEQPLVLERVWREEPDVDQRAKAGKHRILVREELHGFGDRHLENIGNALAV